MLSENVPEPSPQHSNSNSLAAMLHQGDDGKPAWEPEDLQALLEHQLASPIQFDLANTDAVAKDRLKVLCESNGLLLKGFGDLLLHPRPPIELLIMTKDWAKTLSDHPQSPLPREVSMLLYFAAICAAKVSRNEWISTLKNSEFVKNVGWLLKQTWVDEKTKELLAKGLESLSQEETKSA